MYKNVPLNVVARSSKQSQGSYSLIKLRLILLKHTNDCKWIEQIVVFFIFIDSPCWTEISTTLSVIVTVTEKRVLH